jgi:outer membrane receptor for ferrienterochelin and colicin
MHGRLALLTIAFASIFQTPLWAQITVDGRVVVNEAVEPVAGVRLVLEQIGGGVVSETTSIEAGRFAFLGVQPGSYRLSATKDGFFTLRREIDVRSATTIEVSLSPQRALEESVDVPAQASTVELKAPRPGVRDNLTYDQLQSLPAGNSRNLLNTLPLSPSVLADRDGKLHLRGADSQNIQYQVDGIDVTDPVDGGLQSTISSDAVENVEVVASGYAPEYGRSAGGVVRVETRGIPDNWKASLTDMVPNYSFSQHTISEFTPRLTIRGPLAGERLGFMYGLSGEYRKLFDEDLPRGQNAQRHVSGDHVIRTRYTFSDMHLASITALFNHRDFRNAGLSRETPIETTTDQSSRDYAIGVTDRLFFNANTALETIFQLSAADMDSRAKGTDSYRIWPNRRRGNFNINEGSNSSRRQWNENFSWSVPEGTVTHQVKAGVEMSFKYYDPRFELRPLEFYRSNGTLLRRSRYEGGRFRPYSNRETGFFVQDTVQIRPNLSATYGFRTDSDLTTHEGTTAPRIGATWYPGHAHRTRISGGIGYFYDRLLLSSLIQDQFPRRIESVFTDDGLKVAATYMIQRIPPSKLRTPVSKNWELGIEREIAPQWVIRSAYMRRSGWRELQQVDVAPPRLRDKEVWLAVTNTGASEYRALDFSMERSWGHAARVSVAYTFSRSEQSLRVDPFALNIQEQLLEVAPTDWDTPHRVVGWAMFPFFKKSRAGVTVETHSGFPFSVRNQLQEIIGHRNGYRFPQYFNLGYSIEREFPFTRKYNVAVRLTALNLTNHYNPTFVDSNLDSADFMTFGNSPRRGGNIRLRLIKKN